VDAPNLHSHATAKDRVTFPLQVTVLRSTVPRHPLILSLLTGLIKANLSSRHTHAFPLRPPQVAYHCNLEVQ